MSSFDLFVHGFREGDTRVVPSLMEQFGLERDLAEVLELSVPCVMVSALPGRLLVAYRSALERCGAAVQITESGEAPREPTALAPTLDVGVVLELPLPVAARFPAGSEATSSLALRVGATAAEGPAPALLEHAEPQPVPRARSSAGEVTLASGSAPQLQEPRDTVEQELPQPREAYSTDQFAQPRLAARPHAPGLLPQPAPRMQRFSGPVTSVEAPTEELPRIEALVDGPPRVRPRISTEARMLAAEVEDARRWRAEQGARKQAELAPHPLEELSGPVEPAKAVTDARELPTRAIGRRVRKPRR